MPNIATDATQSEYNALYLKSQPAAVQELMVMPGNPQTAFTAKVAKAQSLVTAGYLIDTTIMVWAWAAYQTMKSRIADGYTWVPAAGQPPIVIAPGDTEVGVPPYDAAVAPAKSLIVTLDMDLLPTMFPAPKTA